MDAFVVEHFYFPWKTHNTYGYHCISIEAKKKLQTYAFEMIGKRFDGNVHASKYFSSWFRSILLRNSFLLLSSIDWDMLSTAHFSRTMAHSIYLWLNAPRHFCYITTFLFVSLLFIDPIRKMFTHKCEEEKRRTNTVSNLEYMRRVISIH